MTLILYILVSCGDKENVVVFNRAEVVRLLSSDSSKSWIRMDVVINGVPNDFTECELLTSTEYISKTDSLIYVVKSQAEYCGGNSEVIESGLWDLLEESNISDRIDRIAYYSFEGDTLVKNMREITSFYLTTEENNSGTSVVEHFESAVKY